MTEAQLVSFGNYLLNRYNVQEHSTDGTNTPLFPRQVHDTDLQNWLGTLPEKDFVREQFKLLPSQFQNGDQVTLNFHDVGKVVNCEIIKVHFTDRKVLYDVEVMMTGDDHEVTTRLYNIDSCFVEPADA